MIIRKKKINNIFKYIKEKDINEIKNLRVKIDDNIIEKTQKIGFSKEIEVGETVLPLAIGPITHFNAYGKEKINKKEREKRTIYRAYHIMDWHGQYHDGIAYEVRECYKREYINPYEIELMIIESNGNKYIISKEISNNIDKLKHIINIFLEIFEECEVVYNDEFIHYGEVRRLNWDILPKGKYPWEKIYPYIKKNLENMAETKVRIIMENIKTITNYNPSFVAVGKSGFSGYMIYGFNNKEKVILESIELNNATYILNKDWEDISKLTKAEILRNNLHEKRIIHTKTWKNEIKKVIQEMV